MSNPLEDEIRAIVADETASFIRDHSERIGALERAAASPAPRGVPFPEDITLGQIAEVLKVLGINLETTMVLSVTLLPYTVIVECVNSMGPGCVGGRITHSIPVRSK